MTLPPSDAQSSGFLPHRPKLQLRPVPSLPAPVRPTPSLPTRLPKTPQATLPSSPLSPAEFSDELASDDRAIDFASHSWDLATGGLKTLTAKRELPSLLERHALELGPNMTQTPDTTPAPRSYLFLLLVLVCLVVMLISGGIVLFVMLQP